MREPFPFLTMLSCAASDSCSFRTLISRHAIRSRLKAWVENRRCRAECGRQEPVGYDHHVGDRTARRDARTSVWLTRPILMRQSGLMLDTFETVGLKNIVEVEVSSLMTHPTAEQYWDFTTDVAAPVVAGLSKADTATRAKIREVQQEGFRPRPSSLGCARQDVSRPSMSALRAR